MGFGALQLLSAHPVFDGSRLVTRVDVLGTRTLVALDKGAVITDLDANFADQFPGVVAGGKKGSADIAGVGGTQTFASVELPELLFTPGSQHVALRPAVITMQRNGAAGGECCIANVGRDLLEQGRGFVLDLSTMVLQLR